MVAMTTFRVCTAAVGERCHGGQGENSSNQNSRKLLHEKLLFSFLLFVTQVTPARYGKRPLSDKKISEEESPC